MVVEPLVVEPGGACGLTTYCALSLALRLWLHAPATAFLF